MADKHHVCIESSGKRELHRAGWIVVDPAVIIENGYLEIQNGFIQGVYNGTPKETCIDHGPGVLMPGLVNTHLHLELSALKNSLPFDRGFKAWVKVLLEKRDALDQKTLIKEARKAAQDLAASGTFYAGDISTLGISESLFDHSRLNGICFHEFLGTSIQPFAVLKDDSVCRSLAGHGPHTTSPEVLSALKEHCRSNGLPFSIHVAESDDESRFIHDKEGEWADFLLSRGIDFSSWDIGLKTPVKYLDDMGLLDPLTIAVHVLTANDADMEILARSGAQVCVCPRSNQNLHARLPDIEKMRKKGIKPSLGTDSLASCESLDIFDEMAFVARQYPGLDPAFIFAMGTVNGAKALGMEPFTGTLSRGKKSKFLYRAITVTNKKDLFQRIITND